MKKYKITAFAMMLLSLMVTMASCGEEDNTVEEYANWQATNDNFFNHLSDSVKALLEADPSRTDWKRLKTWSKSDELTGTNADYIIVHVEKEGDATTQGTGCPLYTDTVTVSYTGRLLPSPSYPAGYVFDRTFYGEYDPETSATTDFSVSEVGDGFTTALLNMRRGDRWKVYIPYQLAYRNVDNGNIPACSTVIFDLILTDFRSPAVQED